MDNFSVKAEVHKKLKKGYRVKVSVLNLGMYINGIVVFPPDNDHPDWGVFTPTVGGYSKIHSVEFDKKKTLWGDIRHACVIAVNEYLRSDRSQDDYEEAAPKDFAPTDIPDSPIDLSEIPF